VDGLRERTGIEVPLDRRGILELAATGDVDRLRADLADGATWLDGEALRAAEPAFAGHPGAVLHPSDGAVDNGVLMDALDRAVETTPAIRRLEADVLSVDADQPSALTRTRGRWFATRLVLATGAWAATIPGLPRPLPVRPVRGQLMRVAQSPVRHVTYGGGGYLVPRGDATLVGATSEEAGFESETSLAGLSALRLIAGRAVPGMYAAPIVDHWAGLRPLSYDTHPILGADPEAPAVVYACGFSRNGILFAPWAAERLASLLVGEAVPELEPFRVDRPALAVAAATRSEPRTS
jgi:glycine oxidase